MSITYNDLPLRDVFVKLQMTSFATPQKNLAIYKFVKDLDFYYEALEHERNKCLMKFGIADKSQPGRYTIEEEQAVNAYNQEMNNFCAIEIGIDPPITAIDLSFDDFTDCVYHRDKTFWLNAIEIGAILKLVQKIKN